MVTANFEYKMKQKNFDVSLALSLAANQRASGIVTGVAINLNQVDHECAVDVAVTAGLFCCLLDIIIFSSSC